MLGAISLKGFIKIIVHCKAWRLRLEAMLVEPLTQLGAWGEWMYVGLHKTTIKSWVCIFFPTIFIYLQIVLILIFIILLLILSLAFFKLQFVKVIITIFTHISTIITLGWYNYNPNTYEKYILDKEFEIYTIINSTMRIWCVLSFFLVNI